MFLNSLIDINKNYFNFPFYGSKIIEPAVDLSQYIGGVGSKLEYQKFENGLDLIKIGCFDHWIGNKDRNNKNSNIVLSYDIYSEKIIFHPIDHTAAFAYINHLEVREEMLHIEKSIMQSGFVKSIGNWEDKRKLKNLKNNIELCINNSLIHLDFIFDQVPKEWGFSKKARSRLKDVLRNVKLNKLISEKYFQYLKK